MNAQDVPAPMSSPNPVPMMNSPAPLLRPAIPGARGGGARTPRLGLAIPPSPNAKAVGGAAGGVSQPPQASSRPTLPKLTLGTPMGSIGAPQELPASRVGPQAGQSASSSSEMSGVHSRTDSFGGRGSNPTSAGSQYSNLSFVSQYGLGGAKPHGTPDPQSSTGSMFSNASEGGVDMSRQDSMHGLEGAMDAMTLEKVRKLDADELDDDGWRIASVENRIEELGSLGEGAGGAVTRCKLKGGKTVFALKVISKSQPQTALRADLLNLRNRSSQRTQIQTSRNRFCERSTLTRAVHRTTYADITADSSIPLPQPSPLPWSSARVGPWTASTRK